MDALHVESPADARRVLGWREDTPDVYARGFIGTERVTSRGIHVCIVGCQWQDGRIHRSVIVDASPVGGDLTAPDCLEVARLLVAAAAEIQGLA